MSTHVLTTPLTTHQCMRCAINHDRTTDSDSCGTVPLVPGLWSCLVIWSSMLTRNYRQQFAWCYRAVALRRCAVTPPTLGAQSRLVSTSSLLWCMRWLRTLLILVVCIAVTLLEQCVNRHHSRHQQLGHCLMDRMDLLAHR